LPQPNSELHQNPPFIHHELVSPFRPNNTVIPKQKIHYIHLSPNQLLSPPTPSIPFLQNHHSNPPLMAPNIQPQPLPFMNPQPPFLPTPIQHLPPPH
ncbi:hypothetical protein, partial [Staphylococcus aureus]|uniref:hypothetical protein n=1 Tax=Staphylococcus aureus TaxID=1280 RepID=UPI001C92DF54